MRNTLHQQLFIPSPYNIGGNTTINNQIRSHVIAVLNVKGTTNTFEKPHNHVDYKKKNKHQIHQLQILRDFTEVNEAFRRVKEVKKGNLDNREPKSFQMRITNHSQYKNKQELMEHAKNIQSLYNKITGFLFQQILELEAKPRNKQQFRLKKKSKNQASKFPTQGVLARHNQKQIFLHPRKQYFNLPANLSRPLSAQTHNTEFQYPQPKGNKQFNKLNSMNNNNQDLQCFDFSQAMNPQITKNNQAFEYPKINVTREQLIEKEIRQLRVKQPIFNEFIEKFDWHEILAQLLEIENENIIGEEEFTLQLKELLVHLVVQYEVYNKQYYQELEKLIGIVFPDSKESINEIFFELETYLLK